MTTKRAVSTLAAGLGMAMAFIQKLTDEIVAQGGFEEMIHFLTTERGQETLKKVAELIVKSEWRIPRSLLERLSAAQSLEEWGEGHIEFDLRFSWQMAGLEKRFGIPETRFGDGCKLPIPRELLEQLVGKAIRYPLIVEWEGEPHVIVGFAPAGTEEEHLPGCIMHAEPMSISIAPVRYFDLDR